MAHRVSCMLVGLVIICGLTYLVNIGLGLFLQDPWWRGFWSAMFFAFLSNIANAIDSAEDRTEHLTDMALRAPPPVGDEDPERTRHAVSTYLDARAGIDPPRGPSPPPRRRG